MASENYGFEPTYSPDLIDISADEIVSPVNEEELTQRESNDRRLAQTISYLTEEGGDDSPATFMDRVDRIDTGFLQALPQQGRNFDMELYQRAQAMVREVQLDFEEAAKEDSSSISSEESSMLESIEPPEFHMPSAAHALYRRGETATELYSEPRLPKPAAKEEVRREQVFKYGGPNNDPENWHKNFPASLPFPETFQMAHWESLKIDFDLSGSGKQQKAEGKIVETNIPFDRPELERYKNLPVHESGSRFKLPTPSTAVQEEIDKLATPESLADAVQTWNKSNDKVRNGNYEYTPRVFLEKWAVGNQVDPTTIRHAVNTTPTKSRISTIGSSIERGPSKTVQKGPATNPPTKPIPSTSAVPTKKALENAMALLDEQTRLEDEDAYATADGTRAAREKVRKAREALNEAKQANLAKPRVGAETVSPVARKINRGRATSLERSPRRQSGISTASPSPSTPTMPTPAHPKVIIRKRSTSRPPKSTQTAPSAPQTIPEPTSVAIPKSTTPKKQPKRKRSPSQQNYTPETKRSKSAAPSSLKSTRTRTRKTPDKAVHFLSDESEDSDVPSSGNDVAEDVKQLTTTVVTAVKSTPSKKKVTKKTTAVTKKVTKAVAAGKAVRGARGGKDKGNEVVGDEEYALRMAVERRAKSPGKVVIGSTRSGAKYLKK